MMYCMASRIFRMMINWFFIICCILSFNSTPWTDYHQKTRHTSRSQKGSEINNAQSLHELTSSIQRTGIRQVFSFCVISIWLILFRNIFNWTRFAPRTGYPECWFHVIHNPDKRQNHVFCYLFVFIWKIIKSFRYRLNISENDVFVFIWMQPTNRTVFSGRSEHVWQRQDYWTT